MDKERQESFLLDVDGLENVALFLGDAAGIYDVPTPDYFPRPTHQIRIEEPFKITGTEGEFDVIVRVHGGGLTGHSAGRLGPVRWTGSDVRSGSA